jgi:acyl-CoA thioester hydrolase
MLVVSKISCRYYRPARFGDVLRIRTETTKARAARLDHRYQVFVGESLVAEAESTIACVDSDGQVQRLPDYLQAPSASKD